MYNLSLKADESYYRLLMDTEISRATYFEDLRTVNGVLFNFYEDTAKAIGLPNIYAEWERVIRDAFALSSVRMKRI